MLGKLFYHKLRIGSRKMNNFNNAIKLSYVLAWKLARSNNIGPDMFMLAIRDHTLNGRICTINSVEVNN